MIKKLREKIYNIQTKNSLKSIEFDNFAYFGDSPVPAFQAKQDNQDKCEMCFVFIPKTERTFKIAFKKLKNKYFRKVSCVQMQENIKDYSHYFGFGEDLYNYCMEIYKERRAEIVANRKNKI